MIDVDEGVILDLAEINRKDLFFNLFFKVINIASHIRI